MVRTMPTDFPKRQQFRIPNTWYGRLLLRVMRHYLGPDWTFVLRGRIPDVKKLRPYEAEKQRIALAKGWRTEPRTYTDTQLRRVYHQSCPPFLAKEIGVYLVYKPKARKRVEAFEREQRQRQEMYDQARIDRIVQERLSQAMRDRSRPGYPHDAHLRAGSLTGDVETTTDSYTCPRCHQDVVTSERIAHDHWCDR